MAVGEVILATCMHLVAVGDASGHTSYMHASGGSWCHTSYMHASGGSEAILATCISGGSW